MGRRKKGTPPPYKGPHSTGQAYTVHEGDWYYFGRYGTPASRKKYRAFLAEWESSRPQARPAAGCLVAELADAFLAHVRATTKLPDGTHTSRLGLSARYLRPLVERHGERPAAEFTLADLEGLRELWVAKGLARSTVNGNVQIVQQAFAWGVRPGHVPASVAAELRLLRPLREGEGGKETEEVGPVSPGLVAATLPLVSATVRAMIGVQELVGCRPGELCRMTAGEVSREGLARIGARTVRAPAGLWTFQPERHKTRKKKGKTLVYLLGPKAQALLGPRLTAAGGDGYLFVPRGGRPHYTPQSYAGLVYNACRKAGLETWSPGQLRHNAATLYDAAEGLDTASQVLGHTSTDTTLRYVQRRLDAAAEAVRRHG